MSYRESPWMRAWNRVLHSNVRGVTCADLEATESLDLLYWEVLDTTEDISRAVEASLDIVTYDEVEGDADT